MAVEIINDIPLSLTKENLLQRMGYGGGRQRPPAREIREQFNRAMAL